MRRPLSALLAALLPTALLLGPSAALADSEKAETFHVMEIVQVMAGYNGNTAVQAVDIKELAAGQDLVATGTINIYDKDGILATTLGTFAADVANGTSGAHILCATAAFASAFSITPDLVLTAGILLPSGQVVFEKAGCKVNSVPYGGINTIVANTSVALDPDAWRHGARPDRGRVIRDVQGRLVRVLTCVPGGACPDVAGAFRGSWDGKGERGHAMPSGVYFLRDSGQSGRAVKPIVYLR